MSIASPQVELDLTEHVSPKKPHHKHAPSHSKPARCLDPILEQCAPVILNTDQVTKEKAYAPSSYNQSQNSTVANTLTRSSPRQYKEFNDNKHSSDHKHCKDLADHRHGKSPDIRHGKDSIDRRHGGKSPDPRHSKESEKHSKESEANLSKESETRQSKELEHLVNMMTPQVQQETIMVDAVVQKYEKKMQMLRQQIQFYKIRVPQPLVSLLEVRLSKVFTVANLEVKQVTQYPDKTIMNRSQLKDLQPFKFGAHQDSITTQFGKIHTLRQGKQRDTLKNQLNID